MLLSTSSKSRMAETEKELVVRKTQHKKGVAKKNSFLNLVFGMSYLMETSKL
jgi:hypothetical protein